MYKDYNNVNDNNHNFDCIQFVFVCMEIVFVEAKKACL